MDEDEVPIEDLHAALLAGETTTVNSGPPPVLVETHPGYTLTWTDGGGSAVIQPPVTAQPVPAHAAV
jgi:hypothetical protein